MADWWEYADQKAYYLRRRNEFEKEARRSATNYLLRQQLEERGIMPDAIPSLSTGTVLPTVVQPPEPAKKSSGGILGKIKDVVGDVTETVFRGPVDQPWDVLRPVVQALDWEQKRIGRPIARGAFAGLATLPVAVTEHRSLGEAFGESWEKYEELPGIIREPLEIVASPSTWVPASWVAKGLKGGQLGVRLTVLEPLFGKAALRAMAGGAEEPRAMQQLLERIGKIPGEELAWKGVQETLDDARRKKSLTQLARGLAAKTPGLNRALERTGMKLFDSDIAILAARHSEIGDQIGPSTANAAEAMMRRVAQKAGLNVSNDGRLLGVAGEPFLRDVAAQLNTYPGLTRAQRDAIKLMAEPLRTVRGLEAAIGVKIRDRPADVYFHLQAIEKPVVSEGAEAGAELGPEVARYYGARQAFMRPATYATQAEGVEAGVKYAPFFEAQRVRIEQGYREIADSWLDAAISEIGKTPTELVPAAIREARTEAVTRYAWLRAVDRELSRNLRHAVKAGYKTPTLFEARAALRGAGPMPADVAELSGRLKKASLLPKQADRVAAYNAVKEELKTAKAAAKAESAAARFRQAKFRAGLTAQKAGGTAEYPRFFQGRYYPEQFGAQLQEQFKQPAFGVMEATLNRFNNTIRPITASFDLSFLGIQGLIGLVTNPVAYFQSLKNVTFFGYADLLEQANRSGLLARFLKSGGHISSDVVGEFMVGRTVTKLPVVGPAFKLSNAWFSRFGNVLRLKMFESGFRPGMSQDALKALARNVNMATGYSSGKPHSIETAALFAPRFFRAQLGLVSDALTKAPLKAAKPGAVLPVEVNRALLQVVALIGEGAAVTYGINKLQGKETVFDPTDSNFLRIRAFGRDISVFGPWDTLARAVSVLLTRGPAEGAKYMARSKASPAMARVYDMIEGETFKGQKVDWSDPLNAMESAVSMGSQMLPISVQQSFIEQGIPRTPGMVAGAVTEFMGTKATPLTEWEELGVRRDDIALREYNKKWDELEPAQHHDLNTRFEADLKRPEATTDIGKAYEQRRAIGDRYSGNLAELEKAVQSNRISIPEWREQYIEMKRLQAGEYQQWEASLSPEVRREMDKPSSDPGLKALGELSMAFRESKTRWGTIDPELLDLALAKAEAGWTPAQKAFVDRNTGYRTTPTLTRYREAQKVLKPYWEVREEVWAEFQKRNPELAKYDNDQDYGFALANQFISMGASPQVAAQRLGQSSVLKAVERTIDARRKLLRAKDRRLDDLLFEFYGYTPLYMQPKSTAASRGGYRSLLPPRPGA